MTAEYWDGHPIQAGTRTGRLDGFAEFSGAGLLECVVIARYAVDAPNNRSRIGNEYDVRPLGKGHIINNVRTLQSLFGLSNGSEVIYHTATKNLDDNGKFQKHTPAVQLDGDIVVIGFISGAREQAVILGALPHSRSAYGAKEADGERRFMLHNETTVQIKADGSFELSRKNTVVNVDVNGNVSIKAPSVKLGSNPANTSPAARVGDTVHTSLPALVSALSPYFVASGAPPVTGTVSGSIVTGASSVGITKG